VVAPVAPEARERCCDEVLQCVGPPAAVMKAFSVSRSSFGA
jgi:hypothetical protein